MVAAQVPACLVSFAGDALDEKTPLLRSAPSREKYVVAVIVDYTSRC